VDSGAKHPVTPTPIKAPALGVVGEPNIEDLSYPGKFKACGYIRISVWVDKILDSKYY
jgi:hypothetical protein